MGGSSIRDVAAIIVADDGNALCWYNRRLVHGVTLGMVELWARRAVATGWYAAMLSAADLTTLV